MSSAEALPAYGLGDWAQRDPARPALLLEDGGTVSYGQLFHRAAAIAGVLADAGAGAGAPVALRLGNGTPFVAVTAACNLLGVVHVPISHHASAEESAWIAADAGAAVLVAEDAWFAEAADALAAHRRRGESALAAVTVESLSAAPSPSDVERARLVGPPRGVDGFRMTYTSGTTGRPKAILRDQTGGVEWLRRLWTALDLRPDERHQSAGPYYHAGPNTFVMGQLLFGGAIAIGTRFDAAATLARVARDRLTSLQLVPTMLQRIRALPDDHAREHDLDSLRVLFHAAAPCPPELKRWTLERFGVDRVREYYASSEVGATLITGEEWLQRPGSVGRPLPGCTARVVDPDGADVGAGEPGRVCLRAQGRSTFHHRGGDGRAAAADLGDGWVATDDIGYLDDAGYLFLVDRDADVVISGGVNVYTRKVENILLEHPDVADVAVVGIPDVDLGERVAAAIQLRPGASETAADAELEHFARRRLAPAERPRLTRFVADLPRSEAGKVRKTDLRAALVAADVAPLDPGRTSTARRSI